MGARRLRPQCGFTLIELMVVLVIVAALAGLVVVGSGDSPSRKLQREAQGLATLLNLAADEAVMQGAELGLFIDDEGYYFLMLDQQSGLWQEIEQRPLQRHEFSQRYEIQLVLDGERMGPQVQQRLQQLARRGGEASAPMLLLLSSGELTPFRLTLRLDGGTSGIALHSDGLNPVRVEEAG